MVDVEGNHAFQVLCPDCVTEDWASYLSLIDGYPIRGGKPFVVFDIIDTIPQVSVALGQVHLQQIPQQIFQIRTEVWGEPYLQDTINVILTVHSLHSLHSQLNPIAWLHATC